MAMQYDLPEGFAVKHARGCLKRYLSGKRTPAWLDGMLGYSFRVGLETEDLRSLFSELQNFGDQERYQDTRKRYEEKGWL